MAYFGFGIYLVNKGDRLVEYFFFGIYLASIGDRRLE